MDFKEYVQSGLSGSVENKGNGMKLAFWVLKKSVSPQGVSYMPSYLSNIPASSGRGGHPEYCSEEDLSVAKCSHKDLIELGREWFELG